MKKLILAAVMLSASLNAHADSCNKIVSYAIGYMMSNGASSSIVKYREIYQQTCRIAITARDTMGEGAFTQSILNGSSDVLERRGNPDAADTNTLVAAIAYENANLN